MASIAEILITILADASEAEAGLAEASSAAESSTSKMKGLFDTAESAIGQSMKEAVKHVAEAVGEMVSKFVDAGMGANAAAESVAAGFDKLTGLKTAAIVEATDKVKDFVLNLKNLSSTVPLSLGKIVEFKGAVEQVGGSSQHLPEILQTLSKNMGKAASEGGDAAKKLHDLGISTDGWKEKMPGADTLLVQMAEHIKNSKNPVEEMNKVEAVLGEHFQDLIPLLQQGGAKLKALAEAHVENARTIEGSTQAFEHLQATESTLAEVMQNLLVPIFKVLAQVLDVILQGATKLIEWFTRFGHASVAAGQLVADYYKSLAKIIIDLWRPVFGWLKEKLDATVAILRTVGQWFESTGRAGLAAFTTVKNFLADQLQPVFKLVGEGVDWIVHKFNSLKEWIGRVKDAVFDMAKPVINTFQSIAKEIGDFFHLHWGDVAKDAREAAALLGQDVKKVIDAAKGPAPVDPSHQFGGDAVAYVQQNETKKTNAVRQGAAARQIILLHDRDNVIQIVKDTGDKDIVNWQQGLEGMERDTKTANTLIGDLFQKMPAPLVPALQKVASQSQQIMRTAAHNMATAFSSAIRGMIDGTQTLGQAFAKMGQQMLSSMESMLQKMLSDWLENHVMQLLIHTQMKQSEIAVDQTTSTEKQGIDMKDHVKNIFLAAKEAGANAWTSMSKINPLLGAAAAAAAFAGVMAFGAVGSAEGGQYLVPGPQLTMLHAQEMVLPAGIASRMRDVVEGRAFGDGNGVTVMVNHSVNAIDAESFQKVVRKHGNMIGNEVARVLKKKRFNNK